MSIQVDEVYNLKRYRNLFGRSNVSHQFGYYPTLTRRKRVKVAWKGGCDIQDAIDWKSNF